MVEFKESTGVYAAWWVRVYRKPYNFGNKFVGKPREEYVKAFKDLGFDNICECEFRSENHFLHRVNNQYNVSICSKCDEMVWPHNYIYPCDDCCEPTVSIRGWQKVKEPFYCEYCD